MSRSGRDFRNRAQQLDMFEENYEGVKLYEKPKSNVPWWLKETVFSHRKLYSSKKRSS